MAINKRFKIGDKVSFLNEKGGGVVTKIVDDQIVHVAIGDGFEIPTAVSDLIKISSEDPTEPALIRHEEIEEEAETDSLPLYVTHNDDSQLEEGVYIMMVPEIEVNPLSGNLDIYLVNHTSYEFLFALFLNEGGKFTGEDYGSVEAESRILLSAIGRSEINSWANALLQGVFFKQDKVLPIKPISGFINFKPIKIYKEDSFKFEKLIRKTTFTIQIGKTVDFHSALMNEDKTATEEQKKALQDKINEGFMAKKAEPKKETFLDKHKIDDKIAEIDLHIGELVESYNNLSNKEMLFIQMDYFIKSMNQAEVERLSKVVFIHGIGNGVLKNEIHKYLRNTDGVEYHDASYARYGMGATEVVFYRNK